MLSSVKSAEHALDTLRQIADDPHSFILRQGWASLDFRDEEQIAQLRKLLESLEREIVRMIEVTKRLHESAEFELHTMVEKKPEMFDKVVAKHTTLLVKEISELQTDADQLRKQIEELTGETALG